MRKRVLGLVVVIVVLAALAAVVARSSAGPEKIAFPANYKDGVLYTIADRYDVKQYRELYASAAAVQAAREGKPLPSGTVLTLIQYKAQVDTQRNPIKDAKGRFLKGDLIAYAVMEKRTGWGTEYGDDLRNGEWEYSVFGADGKFNDKANHKACFQCHKPHDQIGTFTFGLPGVTITPGKTVTWTNTDESPHQITVAGTPLKTGFLLKGRTRTRASSTTT